MTTKSQHLNRNRDSLFFIRLQGDVKFKPTEKFTGYLPYFYQWGHYLWQPYRGSTILKDLYKKPSGHYRLSGDTGTDVVFKRPQTVEQIIQHGYLAVPGAEPETAILSDKHQTLWQGLDDIISQVRRRYDIYQQHVHEIQKSVCYALSTIYEVQAYRGGVPADGKERYRLAKQLQELYQLEREERVKCWQDVSKLRLQLPETAQQYLSAHRKVSILDDENGGLF